LPSPTVFRRTGFAGAPSPSGAARCFTRGRAHRRLLALFSPMRTRCSGQGCCKHAVCESGQQKVRSNFQLTLPWLKLNLGGRRGTTEEARDGCSIFVYRLSVQEARLFSCPRSLRALSTLCPYITHLLLPKSMSRKFFQFNFTARRTCEGLSRPY
jgi:hypothetical protein